MPDVYQGFPPSEAFSMKTLTVRHTTLLLLLLLLLGSSRPAPGKEPVSFRIDADPTRAFPGETVTIWINAVMSDDWHIYSTTTPDGGPVPTQIQLQSGKDFQQGSQYRSPRLLSGWM